MNSQDSQEHLQSDQSQAHLAEPLQHPAPPQQQTPALPGNPSDAFVCQWVGCSDRAPSAEALYVNTNTYQARWSARLTQIPGTRLRPSHWTQKHKQPQFAMRLGQLPCPGRQARSHHVTHPSPRPLKATQMRVLRQGLQTSSGPEKACQDSCR